MTKQKSAKQAHELTPLEHLGLRVSAMIQSPRAQLDRQVRIHRLDSDTDEAWEGVMELIAEEEGIAQVFNDDGTVSLSWGLATDGDVVAEGEALEEVDEFSNPPDDGIPFLRL